MDQKVAVWLGISVLEIDTVELKWRQRALDAMNAEAWAENEQMAHATAAAKRQS